MLADSEVWSAIVCAEVGGGKLGEPSLKLRAAVMRGSPLFLTPLLVVPAHLRVSAVAVLRRQDRLLPAPKDRPLDVDHEVSPGYGSRPK